MRRQPSGWTATSMFRAAIFLSIKISRSPRKNIRKPRFAGLTNARSTPRANTCSSTARKPCLRKVGEIESVLDVRTLEQKWRGILKDERHRQSPHQPSKTRYGNALCGKHRRRFVYPDRRSDIRYCCGRYDFMSEHDMQNTNPPLPPMPPEITQLLCRGCPATLGQKQETGHPQGCPRFRRHCRMAEPFSVTVLSASQTGNAKSVADKAADSLKAAADPSQARRTERLQGEKHHAANAACCWLRPPRAKANRRKKPSCRTNC